MRLLASAVAVSVVLMLTACDPGGPEPVATAPAESPSATATIEPTAEAEPAAATVLIRTESLAVLDEDAVVMAEFDYFESPTAAIATLTEVFGGDPVVTAFEGHTHQWPGNYYAWDGFTLIDYDGPSIAYGEDFAVASSAAVVRGLTVETVSDITVGASAAAVEAAGGVIQSFSYEGTSATWYQVDGIAGTDPEWIEWEGGSRIYVNAAMTGPGGTVTILSAPVANYGT